MIVFPCHNVPGMSRIVRAVKSAREHMPEERILVVDSASPDKSYMEEVRTLGAEIADINNKHYEAGAWWYAFKTYPEEQRYYCIHDSCFFTGSLHAFASANTPVSTMLALRGWHGEGQSFASEFLPHTKYKVPTDNNFSLLLGTMMFIDRSLVERLLASGATKLLPRSKGESQAMERVIGIVLAQEGYPDVPSLMLWNGQGGTPVLAAPGLSKEWVHRT